VLKVVATPLPIQLLLPVTRGKFFFPFHEAHYALTQVWKTLFAYQFVIRAAPGPANLRLGGESDRYREDAQNQCPRKSELIPGRSPVRTLGRNSLTRVQRTSQGSLRAGLMSI